jgi:outer membrane receptor protein involved in Fe transport
VNGEWSTITTDAEQRERLFGVYGEVLVTPVAALTLTAGVRADDYNTFDNAVTYRLTGAWAVPSGTTLRTSYGTGFMPPSLSARFGSAFQNPNPGIRPERSRGWDAGVEQALFQGRGKLGLTYFHTSLRDLIGFESAPFPELGRNVNIDRARTSGLEVDGELSAGSLSARAAYTLLSAKSLSETDPTLDRLIRRPRHTLSADVLLAVTSRADSRRRVGSARGPGGHRLQQLPLGPRRSRRLCSDAALWILGAGVAHAPAAGGQPFRPALRTGVRIPRTGQEPERLGGGPFLSGGPTFRTASALTF